MNYSRRDFIRLSGLPLGGVLLSLSCSGPPPRAYRFFTEEEARTVIALCEQIIPADKDPGASDAGVIHFIDKQLMAFYRGSQGMYRDGVEAVNRGCMALHGKRFESLEFSAQEGFLKRLEKGKINRKIWGEVPQKKFFSTLVTHTMQGFYGSPTHGGNKDYVSYSMMGVEYPLVIGQNRYEGKRSLAERINPWMRL